MSLLDRIDRMRKRDELEFSGLADKVIDLERELNLYTREGQFYVLIAVPDADERIELERIIDQTGCFVTAVSSGIETLEQVSQDKFDLVFIARNMPRMDGVQTLRNIKNSPANKSKDAKIFVILNEKVDEPDIFFENEGFDGILRKPFEKTIIQNIIISNVPQKMLPDDEELLEDIKKNADDAQVLKGCDVRLMEGLKNFDGDLYEYKQLAEKFSDAFDMDSSTMLDYLYSGKSQKYMDKARELRETSRKLGAIYLGDCFDDHVNMAKEDSLDVAESNWQSLVDEWGKVVNGYVDWLGKTNEKIGSTEVLTLKTNGIKLSTKDFKERILDILKDFEANKPDEAQKKVNKLSEYELSADKRRKIDQVKRAFEKENLNTAVDILLKL